MIKHLLSISIIFSGLFVGMCSGTTHASTVTDNALLHHSEQNDCFNCEEIEDQDVNCCDIYPTSTKQLAIVQEPNTKVSIKLSVKALQPKYEMFIPIYQQAYQHKSILNKAPPKLQIALPRRE